jgi:hypothetical protein
MVFIVYHFKKVMCVIVFTNLFITILKCFNKYNLSQQKHGFIGNF